MSEKQGVVKWLIGHARSKAAILSYMLLVVVMIFGFFTLENRKDDTTQWFQVSQPVQVISRVPGVKGPAVIEGATQLPVHVDICINGGKKVDVISSITYSRVLKKGGPSQELTRPIIYASSLDPGCSKTDFKGILAPDMGVGLWQQTSLLTVSQRGSTTSQTELVYSEYFKIVK